MFVPRNHGKEPYVVVSERQLSSSHTRCKDNTAHDLCKVSFRLVAFCLECKVHIRHYVYNRSVDVGAEFNLSLWQDDDTPSSHSSFVVG